MAVRISRRVLFLRHRNRTGDDVNAKVGVLEQRLQTLTAPPLFEPYAIDPTSRASIDRFAHDLAAAGLSRDDVLLALQAVDQWYRKPAPVAAQPAVH